MVIINNDIKVLFTKADKDVKVTTSLGTMQLYDNSCLLTKEQLSMLGNYIFTGIHIVMPDKVDVMEITDLEYTVLDYAYYVLNFNGNNKSYICIKKENSFNKDYPIALVSFLPKESKWFGDVFFAHFIEVTK